MALTRIEEDWHSKVKQIWAARIKRDLNMTYELIEHKYKNSPLIKSTAKVYDIYSKKDQHLIGIITKQMQFYNILEEKYQVRKC
ncbi:hypothetical protein BL295_15940 (plasmid) [Lactiplantibacillus plantarum]|nr:hypothetical protein BL295_15940 [Lactiplantibacillus plantarum]